MLMEMDAEEDDRRRRDFHPQSPTHSHPVNGTHPSSPFQQFASRPTVLPVGPGEARYPDA